MANEKTEKAADKPKDEVGTVLSFDTRDNRTIFYTMHIRQVAAARDELTAQIEAISKEGFKPDNPIADEKGRSIWRAAATLKNRESGLCWNA